MDLYTPGIDLRMKLLTRNVNNMMNVMAECENGQNTNRKDHSHATDKSVAIVQDEMSNMKENDFLDLLVLDILVFRSFGFRPSVLRPWSYFQIAGNQPTRLFQTRFARFQMLKNVKNQFKILNVYKF